MPAPTDTLALVCEHLADDLASLQLRRWPLPALGPADVRVAMAAVALNFPDLLMTRGLYQFKPPVPYIPGMEGTGVVVEAGPHSGWQVGDRVGLGGKHGLLAEQVVVPGASLRALPAGLPLDAAAAVMVTGLTAWVALARIGRLHRGETLLVHGARGGVGQACVQIGLHLGARVIATATQPERLADLVPLGVQVLPSTGFRTAVLEATGGRGADVVADPVGGDVFDESARCTAFGGPAAGAGLCQWPHRQHRQQPAADQGLQRGGRARRRVRPALPHPPCRTPGRGAPPGRDRRAAAFDRRAVPAGAGQGSAGGDGPARGDGEDRCDDRKLMGLGSLGLIAVVWFCTIAPGREGLLCSMSPVLHAASGA